MAAPNIVGVTSIYGRVAGQAAGITTTAIVANSNGSNKVLKINSLTASNVDGINTPDITVTLNKNQSKEYHIAKTLAVPPDSVVIIISKDSSIYLEENDSLELVASAANDVEAICSYEEIS